MNEYHVIGLMSGTSLDGLDMVHVLFSKEDKWRFEVLHANYYPYSAAFQQTLRDIPQLDAPTFWKTHVELGTFFGQQVAAFIRDEQIQASIDCVVSHGQTVFHQPEQHYTAQIGCGAALAAASKQTVVCDLRSMDVALNGQGAPLVPMAEHYLFHEHKIFLNLGGIANVSIHEQNEIKAFDIGPANTLLNHYARKLGNDYDENGQRARSGKVIDEVLEHWSRDAFFLTSGPKSLHTDYIVRNFIEVIEEENFNTEDLLATAVELIAIKTGDVVRQNIVSLPKHSGMFTTGGGALNEYLIERISYYMPIPVIVPEKLIVQNKEAIAIGFLGLLRYLNQVNCFKSVTGADYDSMGGCIYSFKSQPT